MSKSVPGAVERVILTLEDRGYRAMVAGGAVRDVLLGEIPKDWDVATSAKPEAVVEAFKGIAEVIPTGIDHGTVTVRIQDYDDEFHNIEVTTLRRDVATDGRHAEVEFVDDFREDAARRDFTINAMFMDVGGNILDYFGGQDDLKHRVIRFVGSAEQRIQEDYLRILRYFRFMARFRPAMTSTTCENAIKIYAGGLKQISGERIYQELSKLIQYPDSENVFLRMHGLGVTKALGLRKIKPKKLIEIKKYTSNFVTLMIGSRMLSSEQDYVWFGSDYFRDKLKASSSEVDLADFLDNHNPQMKLIEKTLDWYKRRILNERTMSRAEIIRNHCIELAAMNMLPEIMDFLRTWEIPVLPVTGQDLIDAGKKPGPLLGLVLNNARTYWIDNDCKPTKKEILTFLGL